MVKLASSTPPHPEHSSPAVRLGALEGLRGLMALWVVLGHISLTFDWRLPLIDRNSLAVDVFVLLSGYVIARLIDRKAEIYPTYLLRRAMRILPLYLLVMLASSALLSVQHAAWTNALGWSGHNAYRLQLTEAAQAHLWPHLLAHLTMVHGVIPESWLPFAPYTLLGQAWSISLEWQFYLCAPLLLSGFGSRWRMALAAALVAGLLITAPWLTNAYLGNRISHFLLGALSYWLTERRGPAVARGWLWAAAALMAWLACRHGGAIGLVPPVIWATVMVSLAAPTGHWRRMLADRLAHPHLVLLGERSYALYLVHMMPLYLSIWCLGRLGMARPLFDGATLAITLGVSYGLCAAAWRWVEAPGIALGSRWGAALSLRLDRNTAPMASAAPVTPR